MAQLSEIVHSDPDILGGTPVFVGTRVPVQSLFDYLEGGETLDEFLRQFPSVKREQAVAGLEKLVAESPQFIALIKDWIFGKPITNFAFKPEIPDVNNRVEFNQITGNQKFKIGSIRAYE